MKNECGFKIGGRNLNNLCYAGDTIIAAENEKDLQVPVLKVKKNIMKKMGLKLKINLMRIGRTTNLRTEMKVSKVVDSFCLLGSTVNK